MWLEAALLAVGCVLFINMGLSDAIQETLGIEDKILSCPKCLVFWLSLAHLLLCGCRFLTAVGASFLLSYAALWLDLGLSVLNKKHNEINEQLFPPEGATSRPLAKKRKRSETGKGNAGMPPVRKEQK